VQIEFNSSVVEVHGENHLEAISVHCTSSGEVNKVPANSMFIMIGACSKHKVACGHRGTR
jgi:thioredoxin reductase